MSDSKSKILLESGTNEVEFLRFYISEQLYAVNVAKVRQVIVYDEKNIVPLPGTPASVAGTLRFRDRPIPVVDLCIYLNMKENIRTSPRLTMVCEFNQVVVAFVVDGVDNIMRCKWTDYVPLENASYASNQQTVIGTIITKTEMIPVLDVELLLCTLIPEHNVDSQIESFVPPHNDNLKSLRIVHCEDSSLVQRAMAKFLSAAGVTQVKTFLSGKEGLEYLKNAGAGEVDILITDIEMPQMDGLTLCKELRQLPQYKQLPVLFFSSTITEEMKIKCKNVGGSGAFSKPEMANIVARLCEFVSNNS